MASSYSSYNPVEADESTAGSSPASGFSLLPTPLNYLLFLSSSLLLFVGYLILPMGIRAQYCGAGRRRYRRQGRERPLERPQRWRQRPPPPPRRSLPPEDLLGNIFAHSHSFSPQEQLDRLLDGSRSPASDPRPVEAAPSRASAVESAWSSVVDSREESEIAGGPTVGGEEAPSVPQLLRGMLVRPPGIRLVAHGTKCRPRPVWITLHCDAHDPQQPPSTPPEYRNCLTWRAELKPPDSSSPATSTSPPASASPGPPRMGNLRRVELRDVLGVERGKKTTALRRVQTARGADERACLSLLTRTGTLDLECAGIVVPVAAGGEGRRLSPEQARAAFVTCLALAMSSEGPRRGRGAPSNGPSPLQSRLARLDDAAPASGGAARWDEGTLFSSLMNESQAISTISF